MLQIRRNETIDKDNPKVTITLASGGSPIIPAELNFTIYEIDKPEKVITPVQVFPTSGDRQPVDIYTSIDSGGGKVEDGKYLAQWQIDGQSLLGRHKIVWSYKLASSDLEYTLFEEPFDIIDYVDVYGSGGILAVSMSEIRTFLRDLPEHHVLIDGLLFSDNDIQVAVGQVVNTFNRMNPPLGEYTSANFPDTYLLTIGTAAWLFDSEANRQLMEQLTYQDGNIHHGITDKTQLYRTAADALKQQFMTMARDIKMQLNINGIYTGNGLGVRFRYNRYVGGKITS